MEVLGSRFRNLFLIYLKEAFQEGKLRFHGEMAGLAKPAAFEALCRQREENQVGCLCQSRHSVDRSRF